MELQVTLITPEYAAAELLRSAVPHVKEAMLGPVRTLAKQSFNKRTRGWKDKPSYRSKYSRPTDTLGDLYVFPYGPNVNLWRWVSLGTRPHIITPTNYPVLVFWDQYRSHTLADGTYNRSGGGTRSGTLQIRLIVHNPGIEARDFERYIKEEIIDEVKDHLRAAILKEFTDRWGRFRLTPLARVRVG